MKKSHLNSQLKGQLKGWITASRPKTLPAAIGPIMPGAALAWSMGQFRLVPVLSALAVALLLQIAANVANDYFDYIHGIDTADRVGPPRAAASGLLSLRVMRIGMICITGVILIFGAYLVYMGGVPVLIVGVVSVISVYLYSAGPFPLSSNALGDLFVFIFFGPVAVCGTYFVQTQLLNTEIVLYSVSIGFLVTAILVVNNFRDIETDTAASKNTLAVVFGERFARTEYAFLMLFAYFIPVLMVIFSNASMWMLLPLLSAPLWIPLFRDINGGSDRQIKGTALNKTLAGTARAGLVFSALLSIGIILGG